MRDKLEQEIKQLRDEIDTDKDTLDELTAELEAGAMVADDLFIELQDKLNRLEDKVKVWELLEDVE